MFLEKNIYLRERERERDLFQLLVLYEYDSEWKMKQDLIP